MHQALQTLLHKRTNFSKNIQSRSSSVDIGEAFQALSIKSNTPLHKRANLDEVIHPRALSVPTGQAEDEKSCYFSSSGIKDLYKHASSFKKAKVDNQSWSTSQFSTSDVPTDSSSGSQVIIFFFRLTCSAIHPLCLYEELLASAVLCIVLKVGITVEVT